MDFKYFSKNGKILPIEEAVVPLSSIEYQYGFGVYENVRVNDGIPYFLKDHVERLMESARIIGIKHRFDDAFIKKSVADLIKKNGAETYNLKILLIGGKEPVLYILSLNPLFPDKKFYKEGADFITCEYERPFPHAKTLNMLQSYLAYKSAKEAGCYDALLINSKGCITEGTRCNFFCIKGQTLISPPEEEILLGVMRKAVLKVAKENGFLLEEHEVRFSDAIESDGAFITSTSSKIIPVRSIDKHSLPPPPDSLRALMRDFDKFLATCKGVLT
ncbi:aminotransferase class IV [Candidatus Kaiserbacteria bacterium]|nr:aminotransferase class IV [Candidatus Kaiserbacteria bacterium]